jgi:hypothetical protein
MKTDIKVDLDEVYGYHTMSNASVISWAHWFELGKTLLKDHYQSKQSLPIYTDKAGLLAKRPFLRMLYSYRALICQSFSECLREQSKA